VPGVDAGTLTYRFDPEVSAMIDPTQNKPRAGFQLLPTSIPVLVLAVTEKEAFDTWPQLAVQVETRWLPRNRHTIWRRVFVDVPVKNRITDAYFDPSDVLKLTHEFHGAMDVLRDLTEAGESGSESYGELRRRLAVLQHVGWGRTTFIDLPQKEPVVTCVTPEIFDLNSSTNVTLSGENLTNGTTRVRIAGVPVSFLRRFFKPTHVDVPGCTQSRTRRVRSRSRNHPR
jgi:hypothetical protein